MAPRLMQILLIFALVWMFSSSNMETMAQTSSNSCTSELANLVPCLNYITGNESKPSSSCCTPLASVVQSQPLCLCLLLNGTFSSSGLTINQTRALGLPGLCSINTPSTSLCNSKYRIIIFCYKKLQNTDYSYNMTVGILFYFIFSNRLILIIID